MLQLLDRRVVGSHCKQGGTALALATARCHAISSTWHIPQGASCSDATGLWQHRSLSEREHSSQQRRRSVQG
jgi:hypothetical protein